MFTRIVYYCELDVVALRQVGFLILEGTEPALDLDIVSPTALAIHTLAYMVLHKKLFVFLAGELTALIRVQDSGLATRNAFLQASIQALVSSVSSQLPPDDTTAVPVNDSCQVQESVLHWNVGDVDGPRLIRTCYISIPKQIRDHSRTLQTLRKVRLRINRIDGHFGHPPSCLLSADVITTHLQLGSYLPGTPGRMVGVQVIDDLLAFQFCI